LLEDSSIGDGPVDAACRAIDKITKVKARLTNYSIKGVTTGKDAMGEVIIQVEFDKMHYIGRAASTDVVEASAKAYLNSINRVLNNKKNNK
jgi:2-isopropylmalate synthase